MTKKFLIGEHGSIGSHVMQMCDGWIGVSRESFQSCLEKIRDYENEVTVMNLSSMSYDNLIDLISCMNGRTNATKYIHFSSQAIHSKIMTPYVKKKRNEEQLLLATLDTSLVQLEIARIGIPICVCNPDFISFGYWDNVVLKPGSVAITTSNMTFDAIHLDSDGHLNLSDACEMLRRQNIRIHRILPSSKIFEKLPARRLNKFLKKFGIAIFR